MLAEKKNVNNCIQGPAAILRFFIIRNYAINVLFNFSSAIMNISCFRNVMTHWNTEYSAPVSYTATGTGGSVVECSPATRAARVRFPASAYIFPTFKFQKPITRFFHVPQ